MEISQSDIEKNTPKKAELTALCLEKKWYEEKLCRLKNFVMETDKEKARDHILEAASARNWLMSEDAPEKKPDTLILIVKRDDGKYFQYHLPQSFGEMQSYTASNTEENIVFQAVPKTNGYNTEYAITDSSGHKYEQLALLYSATRPEWKKAKAKLDTAREKLKEILSQIQKIQSELGVLDKQKPKKKEDIARKKKRREQLHEQQKNIGSEKKSHETSVSIASRELSETKRYIDFPYTPYNQLADTPAMREQGYAYLSRSVHRAWDNPELKKESSLVGRKLSIPQTYPSEISLVLNIVERMDFKSYFLQSGTLKPQTDIDALMRGQINKALTTFALNGENAFNWQRSPVGALGIGQFMPTTYASLQKSYPKVVGGAVFEGGAKDHVTSFRLQALHFHEESRAFPETIKKQWNDLMRDDDSRLGIYALIAAGYNGNIRRVLTEALGNGGDIRTLLHEKTLESTLKNNPETLTYVMKFIFVWKYLKSTYKGFDER